LLLNSSKQNDVMIEGLKRVSDILRLYAIREKLYLPDGAEPAYAAFIEASIDLYSNIFEFQARVIWQLSRSSLTRGFRETFEVNGWKSILDSIQTSHENCTEILPHLDKLKENAEYAKQSAQIEESNSIQKQLLESFESSQTGRHRVGQDKQEAKLLETLASDYKTDKELISERTPGTCEWFFEGYRLLEWRNTKHSSLLWVSAGPGCGKSVLSRALIDERRVCSDTMTTTVCYFFFRDGQEDRTHGASAISAILHQLYENRPALIAHALPSFGSYGQKLKDMFSELWQILIRSAKDPNAGEIVCVLDALDECTKDSRKQLLKKLVSFFSDTRARKDSLIRLKFLVTARPYDDLELNLRPLESIGKCMHFDRDVESHVIGQEINLAIDYKLSLVMSEFNQEDRDRIGYRLKEKENRTYLWVFLTIGIIENAKSNYGNLSKIESLLEDMPLEVSDAYEKILSKSSNMNDAKTLLRIIVASSRPLTLDEANIALTLATQEESCSSLKSLDLWPRESFPSIIRNMCGLFVTVHDNKVSLIHQTARAFLMNSTSLNTERPKKWQGCLNLAVAHHTVSWICLKDIAEEFLKEGVDVDARDRPDSETALCTASENGHTETVQLLLDNGADTNLQGGYYNTALQAASRNGHTGIVQRLLDFGANIDIPGGGYENALETAGRRYGILLSSKADVNIQNFECGSALVRALAGGYTEIVRLLLDENADVSLQSNVYGTALQAASKGGYLEIVKILLGEGADINIQSQRHGSAVQAASAGGYTEIVQLLLDRNAELNTYGGEYGTALYAAIARGHKGIARLL
ncbi:MAG: hypothetical protein Q9164_006703, partial [Protoblastenia rupestris]